MSENLPESPTPGEVTATHADRAFPAPEVIAVRHGQFGVHDAGDTTGFGGLVTTFELPGESQRPYGGWFDTVLMRISDMFLAFPGLVFALAVAGSLGGGLQNAIIALAAISWPKYARIARSQTLAQKETVWMRAAKLSGSSSGKLIFKHILPNIIGPILVTAMLDIGTMMMELAALSFLGLGAKPPTAEWGSMMSDTRSLMTTSPWITFSPGIAIFISVMVFNLLGDTIRDYADPKSRGR